MDTLTIIGCGKVGKTLGLLLHRGRVLALQQVLNRSPESTAAAVTFIGAGASASGYEDLLPADYIMVAASDTALPACADGLAHSRAIHPGTIVFHCSGAQPAAVLAAVKERGALVASVHPVKSFADPTLAAASFQGTYCGLEGEAGAGEKLAPIFSAIGARLFRLEPSCKLVYHAGTVFASNYLTALVEASLRCYERAGIARPQALEMLLPIFEGTLRNNRQLGPARALTGPIARGEEQLVRHQLAAVEEWDSRLGGVYRALGLLALELSAAQGSAPAPALERIKRALASPR
jgi:predicted short-subunit dehydrogenase-like oxidoreductase (DUF2520 family)